MAQDVRNCIVYIDFEASGLKDSYPIEVGMVGNGYSYNSYIKPTEHWLENLVWNPESEKIHNIKQEKIIAEGRNVTEVAMKIASMAEHQSLVSDNGSFDDAWCNTLFEAAGIKKDFMIYDVSHLGASREVFFNLKTLFFNLVERGVINDEETFINFLKDKTDKTVFEILEDKTLTRKFETTMRNHEALSDAIACCAVINFMNHIGWFD